MKICVCVEFSVGKCGLGGHALCAGRFVHSLLPVCDLITGGRLASIGGTGRKDQKKDWGIVVPKLSIADLDIWGLCTVLNKFE